MSLAHAILGFLCDSPMTGYDLRTRCFDESVAYFWPADQAQIYRTLDKLAEEGLISSTVEVQDGRPNRKVYAITEEGQSELDRWLREPQVMTVYREPFLIQLFFGRYLTKPQLLAQFEHQKQLHQARLEVYQAIPLPEIGSRDLARRWVLQRMTLDMGIQTEKTTLAWIDSCMAQIHSMPDDAPDAHSQPVDPALH